MSSKEPVNQQVVVVRGRADVHRDLLTYRNEIGTLQELVEFYSRGDEQIARLLRSFGVRLLEEVSSSIKKACENGVDQAIALTQDPAYHDKKTERHKKALLNSAERRKEEKLEEARKQADPEWRLNKLRLQYSRVVGNLSYHFEEVGRLEAERDQMAERIRREESGKKAALFPMPKKAVEHE